MMYDYFKNMVDGVSQKLLQDPDSINAKKKYVLEIANHQLQLLLLELQRRQIALEPLQRVTLRFQFRPS